MQAGKKELRAYFLMSLKYKDHDVDNGNQLFPISSEQRVRGNGFKMREGFGLFMPEFPDSEGC